MVNRLWDARSRVAPLVLFPVVVKEGKWNTKPALDAYASGLRNFKNLRVLTYMQLQSSLKPYGDFMRLNSPYNTKMKTEHKTLDTRVFLWQIRKLTPQIGNPHAG
jgi:hypothetical protein